MVEFRGNRLRFFRVLRDQQSHAEVGLADPSAGIDPRSKGEAEVRTYRCAFQAAGVDQGREADILPPGEDFDALRDEGAVESAQLGHIGHRAQGHDIQ